MTERTANFQARQGDIFMEQLQKPSNLKPLPNFDGILAYGEVTGHCHAVDKTELDHVEAFIDEQGQIWMRSTNGEPIHVSHDEHGTIELPGDGMFCVSRQREYDPAAAARERQVAD